MRIVVVGVGVDDFDGLAVAGDRLLALTARLVHHPQPIVTVDQVGVVLQQLPGRLLGFVQTTRMDQIDDGVGGVVKLRRFLISGKPLRNLYPALL